MSQTTNSPVGRALIRPDGLLTGPCKTQSPVTTPGYVVDSAAGGVHTQITAATAGQPAPVNTNHIEVSIMSKLTINMRAIPASIMSDLGKTKSDSARIEYERGIFVGQAPVRAGARISFAGIPVVTHTSTYDHGAINTDRNWLRTVRRAMNRTLFTLTAVLGLVSRRFAKVVRTSTKGFGTITNITSTSAGKPMTNSRKVNQQIARAARVNRQRRNGARKQVGLTTQQRRDARIVRANKLAAKQERRRDAKLALASLKLATPNKATQRPTLVGQPLAKGITKRPVLITQRIAAGITDRPVKRRDQSTFSPAIAARRQYAQDGVSTRVGDTKRAMAALNRGMRVIETRMAKLNAELTVASTNISAELANAIEKAKGVQHPVAKSCGAAAAEPKPDYHVTNSSSPLTGDIMDNIQSLLGKAVELKVTIRNEDVTSQPTLGYAIGICQVVKDTNGNIIHGNVNLPIRSFYGYKKWLSNGEPAVNADRRLNLSSLVAPTQKYPIVSIRAAKHPACNRQTMFWFSADWQRFGKLMEGTPEVQPVLTWPNTEGNWVPSHIIEGTSVKEQLNPELLTIRQSVRDAVLFGDEYNDGHNVVTGGGLKPAEGRNFYLFIAEVVNYIGLEGPKQLMFNVSKDLNGNVVGNEKLLRGCFNDADGAFSGKPVTYQRLLAKETRLFSINEMSAILHHSDWETTEEPANKQLVLPAKLHRDLAITVLGDKLAVDGDTFATFNSDDYYKGQMTDQVRSLLESLDINHPYSKELRDALGGKKVNKTARVLNKEVILKPKAKPEPTQAVTAAPIVTGAEPTQVPAAAVLAPEETTQAITTAPTVTMGEPEGKREIAPAVTEELEVTAPISSEYALELARYNEDVCKLYVTNEFVEVDAKAFHFPAKWEGHKNVKGTDSQGTETKASNLHLGAFAVQAYLNALTGKSWDAATDFGGYAWDISHVETIVEVLLSYVIGDKAKELAAHWTADKATGYKVLSLYGQLYTFVPNVGVVDSRGRMFKNILAAHVVGDDKGNLAYDTSSGINSVGAFIRFMYLAYLPLHQTGALGTDIQRVGPNLNTALNSLSDLFPMTSDDVINDNGMVLWAESHAWTPMGYLAPAAPYILIGAGHAMINCGGAMAKTLARHYVGANDNASKLIKGEKIVEGFITDGLKKFGLAMSFNKGCLYNAPGFFTKTSVLRKSAPMIYAQLVEEVAKQCAPLNLEVVAAKLQFKTVDDMVDAFIINNNQKAAKGTKRILLRCPNTIQSGNVIDFTNKPKLRELLEAGRGSKPQNTKWADRVHPDWYSVKAGSKLTTQQKEAEGTLLKVAMMLTAVGPAGLAVFVGDADSVPQGFNDKIDQGEFPLAECCVEPTNGRAAQAGDVAKLTKSPIVLDAPGCVMSGHSYTTVEKVIRGVTYYYFIPNESLMVHGDGVSTVCAVITGEDTPLRPVQHERRGGTGILEWVRFHIAPTIATKDALEVEWKVTPMERQPKIRSVVAKAMLLFADKSFVINKMNPRITSDLVDVVYPNDVIKADTGVSCISGIGATLVYNPDCTEPKFVAMRNLAMDINEMVEGRRHLDYIIEDSTAVQTNPLYKQLQREFFDYFKTTAWTNWQQLENGDFGYAMEKVYQDLAASYDGKKNTWVELGAADLGFLRKVGFAWDKTNNKPVGNLRVFVDGDVTNDMTNVVVLSYNAAGRVQSIKQRSLTLVGKENCPIYDVVMYESSTNKEGCGTNPSGQMDVCVRAPGRMAKAYGKDGMGFMDALATRQAENGKEVGMMHAKMLTLMLSNGISQAISGLQVLTLGTWENSEDPKESDPNWVPDGVGMETLRQLTKDIDWTSPNAFGELCYVLQGYVIKIQSPRAEPVENEVEPGVSDVTYERREVQLWTPFLYSLNGLKAEGNSHNTISGFFAAIISDVLNGKKPQLLCNQLIGMLKSFATSKSVRKFISGAETVNGKVITLPCLPTTIQLVVKGSEQWDLISRSARKGGFDLNKVPTWEQYLEHGEAVWDVLDVEEIFTEVARPPMPDNAIVRVVQLHVGKNLNQFFYSMTNPVYQPYLDGQPDGNPRVSNPYPYTQQVSCLAHTAINGGDADGDGDNSVVVFYKDKDEKLALRALLTTEDWAWDFREDVVGGKGQMVAREAYLGDHLRAPRAKKKIAVWFQKDWLAVTFDKDLPKFTAFLPSNDFNENNVQARILQTAFVGAGYKTYRLVEAMVDLIRGILAEVSDFALPAYMDWIKCPAVSAKVVEAVTNVYEESLGAVDSKGWHMWKTYYEPVSNGKITRLGNIVPFTNPTTSNKQVVSAVGALQQVNYPEILKDFSVEFGKALDSMKCDAAIAPEVAICLWLCSCVEGAVGDQFKSINLVNKTDDTAAQRNMEFVLLASFLAVQAGRGKFSGYSAGTLNYASSPNNREKDIVRIVGSCLKGSDNDDFYTTWATKSHTMLTLTQMFNPEVLGDLVSPPISRPDGTKVSVGYVLSEDTTEFYLSKLAKRVGDIVIPDVLIECIDEEAPDDYEVCGDYPDYDVNLDSYEDIYDDCPPVEEPDFYPEPDEEEMLNMELPDEPSITHEEELMINDEPDYAPDCEEYDEALAGEYDEEAMAIAQGLFAAAGIGAKPKSDPAPVVEVEVTTVTAPTPVVAVEAPIVPAPAPVVTSELTTVLAEVDSLEQRLALAKAALAKQQAEAKALADAKAKRDNLLDQIAAVEAQLAPEYLAQVTGQVPAAAPAVAVTVAKTETKSDEDKGGSAPVAKKPDPKPPVTPAPARVIKTEAPVEKTQAPKAAPAVIQSAPKVEAKVETLSLYTAGSCKGNKRGGWSVYCTEKQASIGGHSCDTTCNAMSLQGVLEALQVMAKKPSDVHANIYSTNNYILNGVRSTLAKQKANKDQWAVVYQLIGQLGGRVKFFHGEDKAAKTIADKNAAPCHECSEGQKREIAVSAGQQVKKHNESNPKPREITMTNTATTSATSTVKKDNREQRQINLSNNGAVPASSKSLPTGTVAITPKSYNLPHAPMEESQDYTPCQQKFFATAAQGLDVFLAGAPGTGKTFATVEYAKHRIALGDKVIATATTGRAVMNLTAHFDKGELAAAGTINSVLQLGIAFDEKERKDKQTSDWDWANVLIARRRNNDRLRTLLAGKGSQKVLFIIDEVSMLDSRLLWVAVNIIRMHNPAIQLLLVGDGNQLQPVSKNKKDAATPFWKAPRFYGCKMPVEGVIDQVVTTSLLTNVRQADDTALEEALKHLAETNELSGVLLERFEGCLNGTYTLPKAEETTHIRFANITVNALNKEATDRLEADKRVYKADIQDNTGYGGIPSWVNEFSPITAYMELGVGMPIKLRINIKDEEGYLAASNGSRGYIVQLKDKSVVVDFEHGVQLEIKPESFEGPSDSKGRSKGTFKQLPLHPDYATTGHSCQGLTINNPVVIGIYCENRVFANKKPVLNEDGSVKTYRAAIQDAEWMLVACSRVTRADQLFFDVTGGDAAVNLLAQSMGGKDTSYLEWLKEVSQ
jgi:DNA replication protein DnaC